MLVVAQMARKAETFKSHSFRAANATGDQLRQDEWLWLAKLKRPFLCLSEDFVPFQPFFSVGGGRIHGESGGWARLMARHPGDVQSAAQVSLLPWQGRINADRMQMATQLQAVETFRFAKGDAFNDFQCIPLHFHLLSSSFNLCQFQFEGVPGQR